MADVSDLVIRENARDVVLVGHSYGGMVITEAAAAIGERIGCFVLLDAFYPDAGDALIDLAAPRTAEAVAAAVREGKAVIDPIPAAVFGVNERDWSLVDRSCTPHPIKTMTDGVSAAGVAAREKVARKFYIRAGNYPSASFDAALAKAQADSSWKTHVVPSGHDVMLDAPDRLCEILLDMG